MTGLLRARNSRDNSFLRRRGLLLSGVRELGLRPAELDREATGQEAGRTRQRRALPSLSSPVAAVTPSSCLWRRVCKWQEVLPGTLRGDVCVLPEALPVYPDVPPPRCSSESRDIHGGLGVLALGEDRGEGKRQTCSSMSPAPRQGLLALPLLALSFGASLGLSQSGISIPRHRTRSQRASSHSALDSAATQGSRATWKMEGFMSLRFGDSSEMG